MTTPTASIIVVTADRPNELRRCLASFHETLPDNCTILVVDASRDDSSEQVVKKFPKARYLRNSVRNMCAQRNAGFRNTTTEIVVYLDDDAIAEPGWLMELLHGFADPDIASVVGPIRQEDAPPVTTDTQPFLTALGYKQPIVNWEPNAEQEVLNGQGGNMSFRRRVLEQIGLFDENLQVTCTGEDIDVFVRLRRAGGRILFNPRAVVEHRPAPTLNIHGYQRSSVDRRYQYWIARNHAYGNVKLLLGHREFFWYFFVHTVLFIFEQLLRLVRTVINNVSVTFAYLLGKVAGLQAALRQPHPRP